MGFYRSKIGPELIVPIAIILLSVMFLMIVTGPWYASLFISLVTAFITHMFLTTNYSIEENQLRIRSGFLYKATIDISAIRKITKTRIALSSPAASLDRIEIVYNKYDTVVISPKDKQAFVDELIRFNPSIQLQL